eukprot:GILI01008247.1.p1 GENE.GILI01008247.1~~GILI01008247.1.p1  ORF type:complete len:472 (-),score=165.83 GILI01008247.1:198-1613(-)
MGLDILLFRDPESLKLLRESQRRRYGKQESIDDVLAADEAWRKMRFQSESMNRFANDCSKTIGERKKKKEADGEDLPIPEEILTEAVDAGRLQKESLEKLSILQIKALAKQFQDKCNDINKQASDLELTRDKLLGAIGNIVHETVPVDNDEDRGNKIERTFGNTTKQAQHKLNHVDIMTKLGCMDTSKTATAMAGGRAYVLRGGLVQLQLALIMHSMNFLMQKGYIPFYPPFFLTKEAMADVAQLSQFDDELYKVTGEGEDKYLIATSEMPIAAYHRGKWFQELAEPIKYAGMSSCFRKEVGSHGRDTLGIFRVHQFDKIEQFVIVSPKDNNSWEMLDKMIGTSEEFCQSLGLPYRVVNICSGALNNAAAKKFDLEGWFPGSGAFRELVSCSNCTDFQSRGVNCRYGPNKANAAKEFVHMLNGTLCAVTRTMCAICENFQTEEGILIPEILQPYMAGKKILRYDEESKIPQ